MAGGNVWLGDDYRVETPERVDLGYALAGIGSRFLAAILDTVILSVLTVVVLVLGFLGLGLAFRLLERLFGVDSRGASGALALAITLVLSFLVLWGYYVFFEMVWHGQSPGKRAVGIRVIKDGGYPIGFADSLVRNVLRLIDFLPAYYSIGAIVMFIDRRSRRLGDLAAGTVVVKERHDLGLETLSRTRLAGERDQRDDPVPNLSRLSADDVSLIREYLLRRSSLDRAPRIALEHRLASMLRQQLELESFTEPHHVLVERIARQLGL